ncbi:MAG: integrase/recombinase [Candidatus Magnetoglobus multicellularis str. Araruama]|uniref:Integrase/recombinase n=1 Tax=Candidatus Magnetoglobus multicellularis str. Araruama TaxID=890399 RepID=A0A1V1P2B8_9BACT|nr:MAG: integrase/recombinase [Candidatus Magnetoglobus multicellularis str. Araruama]
MNNFPKLLQNFFVDRLAHQRQASSNTIASYRDTFRILFEFANTHLNKQPSELTIEDLDASFIGKFLNYLEENRGNSVRSRNVRLAAIHSFFRFANFYDPTHSDLIQRVLSIPSKKYDRKPIHYLSPPEIKALVEAPQQDTWAGRRDKTLILLAIQTGLRVSELIGLNCQDVILGKGAHVKCIGKGRKERCIPLRKDTKIALCSWLEERNGDANDPLFPNARGKALSRDGVEYLLSKHVAIAVKSCPSLKNKRVSPHVLRHTAAMELLQNGVDTSVIALWLGHESTETTQIYIHANLQIKEQALEKTSPIDISPGRFKPNDQLLDFLKNL